MIYNLHNWDNWWMATTYWQPSRYCFVLCTHQECLQCTHYFSENKTCLTSLGFILDRMDITEGCTKALYPWLRSLQRIMCFQIASLLWYLCLFCLFLPGGEISYLARFCQLVLTTYLSNKIVRDLGWQGCMEHYQSSCQSQTSNTFLSNTISMLLDS